MTAPATSAGSIGAPSHLDPRVGEERRVFAGRDADDDVRRGRASRDRQGPRQAGAEASEGSRDAARLFGRLDGWEAGADAEEEGIRDGGGAGDEQAAREHEHRNVGVATQPHCTNSGRRSNEPRRESTVAPDVSAFAITHIIEQIAYDPKRRLVDRNIEDARSAACEARFRYFRSPSENRVDLRKLGKPPEDRVDGRLSRKGALYDVKDVPAIGQVEQKGQKYSVLGLLREAATRDDVPSRRSSSASALITLRRVS